MNFTEEVAGSLGNYLSKHLLYEDGDSEDASHVVETIHPESFGASVVARVYRFGADDRRHLAGRLQITVEDDSEPSS